MWQSLIKIKIVSILKNIEGKQNPKKFYNFTHQICYLVDVLKLVLCTYGMLLPHMIS